MDWHQNCYNPEKQKWEMKNKVNKPPSHSLPSLTLEKNPVFQKTIWLDVIQPKLTRMVETFSKTSDRGVRAGKRLVWRRPLKERSKQSPRNFRCSRRCIPELKWDGILTDSVSKSKHVKGAEDPLGQENIFSKQFTSLGGPWLLIADRKKIIFDFLPSHKRASRAEVPWPLLGTFA